MSIEAKLTIPSDLNEISLRQYQEWLKLDHSLNSDFLDQKMIEIFCGVKLSHVLLISRKDIRETVDHLVNLLNTRPKHVMTFKVKGQEFGMIPNLDEMSMGEYIDLDTFIGDWQDMHKAMAVLYRPIANKIKDKYTIHDYTASGDTEELMQYMPLGVVFGAVVFFYRLGIELLKAFQASLTEEVLEVAITAHKHNLPKNMDGIIQSMPSLKETLDTLIQSQLTELDNV